MDPELLEELIVDLTDDERFVVMGLIESLLRVRIRQDVPDPEELEREMRVQELMARFRTSR